MENKQLYDYNEHVDHHNETKSKSKLCNKCKTVLDINFKYVNCDSCREKERIKDRNARDKIRELNKNDPNNPYCINCNKQYGLDHYQSEKGKTDVCLTCRDKMKAVEKKRNKRHRNWKEEMDRNPDRKQKKEQWKQDNYDKVAKYSMDSRGRKIERLGIDEYRKLQASYAAKYRKNNPDKMKYYNEKKRSDVNQKIKVYKRKAKNRGDDWNLTNKEAYDLILGDCFYCNDSSMGDNLNGIDRINNVEHYDIENCVSCCKQCNNIKRCLDPIIFIKRTEHILTYQKIINGDLNYNLYYNYEGTSYENYKDRAESNGIEFSLSVGDYNKLIINDCYICGKKTDENHTNGIDRYNNFDGYNITNVRSCCGECNYMKSNLPFVIFIDKLYKIYKYHIMNIIDDVLLIDNYLSNARNYDDIYNYLISIKLFEKLGKLRYIGCYGPVDINYSLLNRKSIVKSKKIILTKIEKQAIRKENQLEKDKRLINNNTNDEYKLQKISQLKKLRLEKISNDLML